MALIPLVFEEEVARDLCFPLVRRKGITQRAFDVVVDFQHFELTPQKRTWIIRKATYMLEADQIVTGLSDSIDLPEGIVAENKVRFNLLISRFKALKPVQPYLI